jgi:D-alanine-D-alanine ligase
MSSARVLVVYNDPVLPVDHPDAESEHEILEATDEVVRELSDAGFATFQLGLYNDPADMVTGIRQYRPDVVFNLFEGTAERPETEAVVAGYLDWVEIPYTGSPYPALCLARDKALSKHLFQGAGLPTPPFQVVEELPVPPCRLRWPVIVKPAQQDASVGLDQGSVVTNQQQLEDRVALLMERYPGEPVMIEQFIAGRELNVALVDFPELHALPISEILFLDKDPGRWPIVTYDAKWKPESRDCVMTPPQYPAKVDPLLAEALTDLSTRAFKLTGCRDYARCDFRVTPAGEVFLLEVNPNPDYHPSAGFTNALKAAGKTHAQFTVDLAHRALARGRNRALIKALCE